ncbi:MAG: hypothetical protein OEZ38_13835 [Gammaproteobacteria bacterium]|nr:hypothetical protein [Gammaproteobacteria bacterium]
MNLYQDIFFNSLDKLRGRKTIQRLKFLRQSQSWNIDQIKQWQLERLNELLIHAKNNSLYYKKHLSNINLPLRSLSEITKLPILTKDNIREYKDSIKCSNISNDRFVEARTGGSTGVPMFYFWDKMGMDWNRGSVYRSAEWAGTALGEKTIQMSGSHFDYSQSQKLITKFTLFLQRYRDLSVAFLTDDILEEYYQQVIKFKPTSIWGYASGITALAKFINQHHPDSDFSYLKAIMTSSEMLWPEQRIIINKAFKGEKVFNQYGSREIYIGSECNAHNGYHVHSEVIIAEIIDKDGNSCKPGETGRVILTDLSNKAFPFIRYEIGDIGILEKELKCSCGMELPRIRQIEGRIADVIVLKDRILTPPNFTLIFSDYPGVKLYQIRQDKLDEIIVLIVPDESFNDSLKKYIYESIKSMVNSSTSVVLKIVDDIEVSESGKRRFIVSSLGHDYF